MSAIWPLRCAASSFGRCSNVSPVLASLISHNSQSCRTFWCINSAPSGREYKFFSYKEKPVLQIVFFRLPLILIGTRITSTSGPGSQKGERRDGVTFEIRGIVSILEYPNKLLSFKIHNPTIIELPCHLLSIFGSSWHCWQIKFLWPFSATTNCLTRGGVGYKYKIPWVGALPGP